MTTEGLKDTSDILADAKSVVSEADTTVTDVNVVIANSDTILAGDKATVPEVTIAVTEAKTAFTESKTVVTDVNTTLTATTTAVTGTTTAVTGTATSVTGTTTAVTGTVTTTTAVTGTTTAVTGTATSVTGTTTAVTGTVTTTTAVTGTATAVTGTTTATTAVTVTMAAVTGTVTAVTGIVTSVTSTTTAVTATLTAVTGTLTAVTGTLTAVTGTTTAVTGTITNKITNVPQTDTMAKITSMYYTYRPTIYGVSKFTDTISEQAGLKFKKGIEGGVQDGISVSDFISVLGSYNHYERSKVDKLYKTQFGKSMVTELNSELRGDARDLAIAMMSDPAVNDAKCMKVAISGNFPIFTSGGTDEDALIEILASRSNYEIEKMKTVFQEMYGKDLETEVMEDTSGRFELFLAALLNANRDETNWDEEAEEVSADRIALTNADVEELYTSSLDVNLGNTTFYSFNRILCMRSYYHLREVIKAFETKYKFSLETVIKRVSTDHLRDGYLAICKLAVNPADYFEDILYRSIVNQDEKTFLRVLLSRSEKDLGLILSLLREKRGKAIKDFISLKTSSSYRQLLIALVGEYGA